MSIVKINAIAVGEGKGEELEKRFQAWVSSQAFERGHRQAASNKNDGTVAHGSAILGFEVVIKTEGNNG